MNLLKVIKGLIKSTIMYPETFLLILFILVFAIIFISTIGSNYIGPISPRWETL